ncbi:MAG: SRPBCC family protein [Bryobacteraceae bacterium]
MATFVMSSIIAAPVEVVFGFHEREDALALLSPPFPPMRVLRKTGGLQVGAEVELQIGPIRWLARHTGFEKNRFFEDVQVSGPFEKWVHRHEFESVPGGTRLTDRVEYRFVGGALTEWAVRIGLWQMFRYRHRMTKRFCSE